MGKSTQGRMGIPSHETNECSSLADGPLEKVKLRDD